MADSNMTDKKQEALAQLIGWATRVLEHGLDDFPPAQREHISRLILQDAMRVEVTLSLGGPTSVVYRLCKTADPDAEVELFRIEDIAGTH